MSKFNSFALRLCTTHVLCRKLNVFRTRNNYMMEEICIYNGLGMDEDTSSILRRTLTELADTSKYKIDYVTPAEILNGRLQARVVLLAIGGGYDLGLIQALGQLGMDNIRDFVHRGGSYLGFCSGAYFACDRIEFDKGGPLEVVGDRALKFFPGLGKGPLFKQYDCDSRSGAVTASIDFTYSQLSRNLVFIPQPIQDNGVASGFGEASQRDHNIVCNHGNIANISLEVKDKTNRDSAVANVCFNNFRSEVYLNGGVYFEVDKTDAFKNVTILSRYLRLPDKPPAVVKCQCGKGVVVLSGPHLEYDDVDIDEDPLVTDIVPVLMKSKGRRRLMLKCLLEELNINTKPLKHRL